MQIIFNDEMNREKKQQDQKLKKKEENDFLNNLSTENSFSFECEQ